MTDYLAPINRYQFAQFYRHGYTYIPNSTLLKFDGHISEGTKVDLAKHFSIISPFDYDEEYLILHLSKIEQNIGENVLFEVQEIAAIYPLSKQAKISIQEKIDNRINLSEPLFESVLPLIEDNIQKKEIEKAIDALWQICNIEGKKDELVSAIGIENIFKGLSYRQQGIKTSKILDGEYWSMLIAYDRFDYFPNETIGYFYDAGQVFAHVKNQPTFEGSSLHGFLNGLNKNLKLKDIIFAMDNSAETEGYRIQTSNENLKQYIVSALYLMLKDELRNADDLYSTKLLKFTTELKKFGTEFKAAIILLGAFFGFKKFYDLYYDKLNLRFHKSYAQNKIANTQTENNLQAQGKNKKGSGGLKKEVSNLEKVPSNIQTEKEILTVEVTEEPNLEKSPKENEPVTQISNELTDEFSGLKESILRLIESKGEMTITELGKEIYVLTRKKMKNEIIENILKDISEIEKFKDKRVNKIRLSMSNLFKA